MEQLIDKEMKQVEWGMALFAKFLLLAEKRVDFDSSLNSPFLEEISLLQKGLNKEESLEKAIEKLNQLIVRVNNAIEQKRVSSKFAPFPLFSLVKQGQRSGVLDQFDMLQRTLTEASEAKVLDWVKAGEFFQALLKLFSLVEKGKLPPHEAISLLAKEIEKINPLLPKEFQLPPLNLNAYPLQE